MIKATPTEHLTGIILEGEYLDFYEIVDSIYRMTGLEDDYNDLYWSVKNRLLGMCYDIRHAYQGDRDVKLVDNGVTEEWIHWHDMIMPKENVHVSVCLLFPEAAFVALALPEMMTLSRRYYARNGKNLDDQLYQHNKYSDYLKDKALLEFLSTTILQALGEVIGDVAIEKIMRHMESIYDNTFMNYAAQYLDKCNIEYLKTAPEKRKDKLKNIVNRIIKKPSGYQNMEYNLQMAAKEYACSIHELEYPGIDYPEEVEW